MKVAPVSIEVNLDTGLTMRGYEWPIRGAPVVLLHDYEEDLDVWKDIDQELAKKGFRVINLELRGHGFSDGEPNNEYLFADVQGLLKELGTVWGPLGLCTHGHISEKLFSIQGDFAPKVHVAVSPLFEEQSGFEDASRQFDTSYLVISGTSDEKGTEQARQIFDRLGPKKLWASVASVQQGPKLLREHQHLIGDMTLFLQRYLVPLHQAWQEQAIDQAILDAKAQDSEIK